MQRTDKPAAQSSASPASVEGAEGVGAVDDQTNRWNFRVLLGQGVTRGVGSELSSEKLVLPFLYTSLGGLVIFAGMLLPIASLAKLGAQLFGAPVIEAARFGKWYLATATTITALALAFLILNAAALPPFGLVAVFLLAAAALGMSNGFGSLTFQDMLGRVLREESRGNLLFAIAATVGVATIIAATASTLLSTADSGSGVHLSLVWTGIGMFLLASLAITVAREAPKHPNLLTGTAKESIGREHYFETLQTGLGVVWYLPWFRKFLVALMLFLSVELVMPFVAIHAATFHADTSISLSMFVVTSSLGMVIGGILWPRVGKKSIKLVLSAACLVACVSLLIALAVHLLPALQSPLSHALIFGLLSMAGQGVLIGRTVYVVNSATVEQRPFCVAVANFTIGIVGLGLALIAGTIAHAGGVIAATSLLAVVNVIAAIYVTRLPDIRHEVAGDPPQDEAAGTAGRAGRTASASGKDD